jgi:hypothetical protein
MIVAVHLPLVQLERNVWYRCVPRLTGRDAVRFGPAVNVIAYSPFQAGGSAVALKHARASATDPHTNRRDHVDGPPGECRRVAVLGR